MKNFIISIIKTDKVDIIFSNGSSFTFEKPTKDEITTDVSIVLSHKNKDYFINLNYVAHVTKHVEHEANFKTFNL